MLPREHVTSRNEFEITTERVDDVPLLIGMMVQMGLPQVLDMHIPPHWKQRELSWGWTAVIWLAYILSTGDHRKVAMEDYVIKMQQTLREVSGQAVSRLDFTDDRLGILLRHLSTASYWEQIEAELNERTIRVYDLEVEIARCDASTASGYHEVSEEGLFQFGQSKDDPSLPQIKFMTGSLDPLGLPLVTDVVSGEQADDGLYLPVIHRIHALMERLGKQGVLYVGDCKLSAFETRLQIHRLQSHYLCPLPRTGKTAEEWEEWVWEGIERGKDQELHEVVITTARDEEVVIAAGYEFDRQQVGEVDREPVVWTERVLVVKSFQHAKQQERGLEKRVARAEAELWKLTPPRGRGKRQITEEETLQSAIAELEKTYRVEGLLTVAAEREVERQIKYIGRGRGSANRPQRVIERIRYQITSIIRNEEKIEKVKEHFGWRAYVSDAPKEHLSLEKAVSVYRQECRIERIFHRVKHRLHLSPMFVTEPDQVTGLTHLLMTGVRVLTLMEFVVRRSLQKEQATLSGLHPENRQKKLISRPVNGY